MVCTQKSGTLENRDLFLIYVYNMAVARMTSSTQCNLFILSKTTKYVQVQPQTKEKGVFVRPNERDSFSQTDTLVTSKFRSVTMVDKYAQCVTTLEIVKRNTATSSTQTVATEVLATAVEKVLYVLRTTPAYDTLHYDVS